MKKKKILIVSYTFPPTPGIGGRRWAKFAKYLHRAGHDIKVIRSKDRNNKASDWIKDVEEYRDKVLEVPSNYPKILDKAPRTLWEKLAYRASLLYVKALAKGNYYDRAAFWKKTLLSEVKKQILEGYDNLIVTSPPYRASFFISTLKTKYPNINLLIDIRDLWSQNKNTAIPHLSNGRRKFEEHIEKETLLKSDHFLVVNERFQELFGESYPKEEKKKIKVIQNGFDREDLTQETKSEKRTNSGSLRLLYAGTFYRKSVFLIKELVKTLTILRKEGEELCDHLKLDIYGKVPEGFHLLIKDEPCIEAHGMVSLQEVQKLANEQADAGTLFLNDNGNFNFSTKFYEYIAQNLPIIVFSNPGRTGEYVEENGIGHACFTGRMKETLKRIYKEHKTNSLRLPSDLNIDKFNVQMIAEKEIAPLLK